MPMALELPRGLPVLTFVKYRAIAFETCVRRHYSVWFPQVEEHALVPNYDFRPLLQKVLEFHIYGRKVRPRHQRPRSPAPNEVAQ